MREAVLQASGISIRLRGGALIQHEQLCPLCRVRFRDELPPAPLVACPSCGTLCHQACSAQLGGCPTLGCPEAVTAPPRPAPRVRVPDAGRSFRLSLLGMALGLELSLVLW